MAYNGKTNWQFGDTVTESDLNRIEQGIKTLDLDKASNADLNGAINAKTIDGAVRAATTANIALSGLQTIDGVALVAGDRVLVKSQTAGSQNGIYVAAAGAWTRSADADSTAKIAAGISVYVREGTAGGGKTFSMNNTSAVTLGTTTITFEQSGGAGAATDASIGNRTISDATVPTGDSGTITTLFGWLANMIKAITGGASWRTAPVKTLAALNTEKAPIASPTFTGTATAPSFTSTVATGTAPMTVASQTAVTNLNADMVDGWHTSFQNDANTVALRNSSGNIAANAFVSQVAQGNAPLNVQSSTLVANLNADKVDGLDASTATAINTVAARDGSGDLSAATFKSTTTGAAPLIVASTTLVPNLNADMLDGKHASDFALKSDAAVLPQPLGMSDSPTFADVYAGNATSGYTRIATTAAGSYIQAVNGAKNGSQTLWLTGYATAATTVKTAKNTLDDSTGNATFAGAVSAPTLAVGGSSFNKLLGTFTLAANTTSQKVDVYFPASSALSGWLDITVSGSWNGNNFTGNLTKRIALVTNTTGTISAQESRYIEATGGIKTRLAISDVTWDATNSRYRIQIAARVTSTLAETLRVWVAGGSNGAEATLMNPALGTVYTTDTTVLPIPVLYGSGSGLDADLLDGKDGSAYAPTANPSFSGTLSANQAMVGGGMSKSLGIWGTSYGVDNQKVDITFPRAAFAGALDIRVTGNTQNGDATGMLVKRIAVKTDFSGNLSSQVTKYEAAIGNIVNVLAISDMSYDSSLSAYKVTLAQNGTTFSNNYTVSINAWFELSSYGLITGASLGSTYTTDTTVFPAAVLSFPNPPSFTTATGKAPFTVASTTTVTNLNADTVDGLHASSFPQLAGSTLGSNVPNPNYFYTVAVANTYSDTGNTPALFQVMAYLVITKAATITLRLTYTDSSGAQTLILMNQAMDVGSYTVPSFLVHSAANQFTQLEISSNVALPGRFYGALIRIPVI